MSPSNNDGWITIPMRKSHANKSDKNKPNNVRKEKTSKVQKYNATIPGAVYVSASPSKKATPAKSYATPTAAANKKPQGVAPKASVQQGKASATPQKTLPQTPLRPSAELWPIASPANNIVRENKSKKAPPSPIRRPPRVMVDGCLVPDTNPAALGIVAKGSWEKAATFLAKQPASPDSKPTPALPRGPNPKSHVIGVQIPKTNAHKALDGIPECPPSPSTSSSGSPRSKKNKSKKAVKDTNGFLFLLPAAGKQQQLKPKATNKSSGSKGANPSGSATLTAAVPPRPIKRAAAVLRIV